MFSVDSMTADSDKPVRIGCVGVGGRGTDLMRILLEMPGVEVPAVYDITPVKCPDFTGGKWETSKAKFAVEES